MSKIPKGEEVLETFRAAVEEQTAKSIPVEVSGDQTQRAFNIVLALGGMRDNEGHPPHMIPLHGENLEDAQKLFEEVIGLATGTIQ